VVEIAHRVGLSVEAGLGHVGLGEEEISDKEWGSCLARTEDATAYLRISKAILPAAF
jgi:fructose/tagatose bisphosphate aldolase